jgi:hypothetical protein
MLIDQSVPAIGNASAQAAVFSVSFVKDSLTMKNTM